MSQIYRTKHVAGHLTLKDPETGLLYTNSAIGFTLPLKKKFLEIAEKAWPNVSAVCNAVGISTSAYRAHYMIDKVFRERIDAIAESLTDEIEACLATYAKDKSNFMDRIAWLRAHRGEKYNEKKMIQVDVNLTKDKMDAKKQILSQAIDADIIGEEIASPIVTQEISNESL